MHHVKGLNTSHKAAHPRQDLASLCPFEELKFSLWPSYNFLFFFFFFFLSCFVVDLWPEWWRALGQQEKGAEWVACTAPPHRKPGPELLSEHTSDSPLGAFAFVCCRILFCCINKLHLSVFFIKVNGIQLSWVLFYSFLFYPLIVKSQAFIFLLKRFACW